MIVLWLFFILHTNIIPHSKDSRDFSRESLLFLIATFFNSPIIIVLFEYLSLFFFLFFLEEEKKEEQRKKRRQGILGKGEADSVPMHISIWNVCYHAPKLFGFFFDSFFFTVGRKRNKEKDRSCTLGNGARSVKGHFAES